MTDSPYQAFEVPAVRIYKESIGMARENAYAQATDSYPSGEDNPNKWVYIKVKRKKSTYFLHIDFSETIGEVKAKLQELVEKDPKEIKLYRDGSELSESTTLAESKAENGDTIAMALALPGEPGKFEDVDITPHDAEINA